MTGGASAAGGFFKGSRGNAAGKFFCGCMVSRSVSVSDLGLLTAGVDVPASGTRRFYMVFGDGIRAVAAVAASVSERRRDCRLDSRGR
jgi:hypothetical protein